MAVRFYPDGTFFQTTSVQPHWVAATFWFKGETETHFVLLPLLPTTEKLLSVSFTDITEAQASDDSD